MHSWARKTKGHIRTFHTPSRDKVTPTAGDGNFSLSSNKEFFFFSNVFLLAGLAQKVMVLNINQFCTNSLPSPHANHQTDPVTPLTGSCTRQVTSTAHPADGARWQSGPRSHTPSCLCASWAQYHAASGGWPTAPEPARTWSSQELTPEQFLTLMSQAICHNAPHSSSSH